VGTAVNGGPGKVEITYSGGSSYTPNQRGTFTVTITDTGTPARQLYGFEASARLGSNLEKGQAGTLIAGTAQRVICENEASAPCPSGSPVQFVEHSQPNTTGVFTFDWTPPAAGSGDVVVYVAGNAANGSRDPNGDRIYTANVRLTEAAASSNKPAISNGGVLNNWSPSQVVASNTWLAIYGSNFTTETKDWSNAPEFGQGKLPLSVGGVSVTINGKSAPVYFISPGQVNVLGPDDTATGNVQVIVKNAQGESAPVTVTRAQFAPALVTFNDSGKLRVIARLNSNPNLILGLNASGSRPFAPGELIQFYASGLGPTNPAVPVENASTGNAALVNAPTIRIGDQTVSTVGSALVGPGLYQINGTIPDVPDGEYPAYIEVGGTRSPDNITILIKR